MIHISTDKTRLQIDTIHSFLTETYWAKGRSIGEVKKTINHSYCFGVYIDDKQIGFARIITDFTFFAYIMDLFIVKEYQGKGYSKQLVNMILNDEKLKGCKSWVLKTADAHGLYKQFGFKDIGNAEKWMELKL